MTRRIVALVALLATASLAGRWLGSTRRDATVATVVEVIDGDTVVVARSAGGEVVRLLGVDTPETVHPARPVECHGPEASAFTKRRLLGRQVRLEFDAVRRDPYGRLLAFVYVDGERFNDVLLRGGFARLLVIPPNGAHGRDLLKAELEAEAGRRGLWGACAEAMADP